MFEIVQESVKVYTTTGMPYLLHTFVQKLYAQNPVFEIVREGSVKVYLHMLFGILGSRCLIGSALLDCHVLKGFGICMIGILDSLSDVVEALFGHSSCNLDMQSVLDNIKGIESPFFLFRPLTKLPHPNTIYR